MLWELHHVVQLIFWVIRIIERYPFITQIIREEQEEEEEEDQRAVRTYKFMLL